MGAHSLSSAVSSFCSLVGNLLKCCNTNLVFFFSQEKAASSRMTAVACAVRQIATEAFGSTGHAVRHTDSASTAGGLLASVLVVLFFSIMVLT